MKTRYSVDELIKKPFTQSQISALHDKTIKYKENQKKLFTFLLILYPFLVSSLYFIGKKFLSPDLINSLDNSDSLMFYSTSCIFLLFVSLAIVGSIYFSYVYYASPLKVAFDKGSRTQYDMDINKDSFEKCEDIDMTKINEIERLRNFYYIISTQQKRPLYNFEYLIILEMNSKIKNM